MRHLAQDTNSQMSNSRCSWSWADILKCRDESQSQNWITRDTLGTSPIPSQCHCHPSNPIVRESSMSGKGARLCTKEWHLDALISSSANFYPANRVPANSNVLSQLIKDNERKGLPLVIEGFHKDKKWPAEMFTIEGFQECSESKGIHHAFGSPANLTSSPHRYWCPRCSLLDRQGHENLGFCLAITSFRSIC